MVTFMEKKDNVSSVFLITQKASNKIFKQKAYKKKINHFVSPQII